MKDGNKFLELAKKRDALKTLWVLFSSPLLKRDALDWQDFFRGNKTNS